MPAHDVVEPMWVVCTVPSLYVIFAWMLNIDTPLSILYCDVAPDISNTTLPSIPLSPKYKTLVEVIEGVVTLLL